MGVLLARGRGETLFLQDLDAVVLEEGDFGVVDVLVVGREEDDLLRAEGVQRGDERFRGRGGRDAGDFLDGSRSRGVRLLCQCES